MMPSIPVFIPYVNRPDLLRRAIDSVPRRLTTTPCVINNSGSREPVNTAALGCNVIHPCVPLSFAQTQNLMLNHAKAEKLPFYMFLHSDAEAGPESVWKLYQAAVSECSRRKWGALFTNYDALAAFSTAAFAEIGGWDTALEWYHSDADVYRRLRLAGYPTIETGLPVVHEPSQTLKSDPLVRLRVDVMMPCRQEWYRRKWGGDIGNEIFDKPFNGQFDAQTETK